MSEMPLAEALNKARLVRDDPKFKDMPSVSRTLLAHIEEAVGLLRDMEEDLCSADVSQEVYEHLESFLELHKDQP